MEKNTSVANLELLGGRACLDFANTVVVRGGRESGGLDVLVDYPALVAWAERVRLIGADHANKLRQVAKREPSASSRALAEAKRLRETLYAVFSALAEGSAPGETDLELLATAAAQANKQRRLEPLPSGGFGWRWTEDHRLDAIALRVALDAADLLVDRTALSRMKECPGRNCGWLFYDQSRNRRRRWCSDADCGNVERVARYRRRH